jgi:alkylation response protein AidB-like acyl-CoA dehydrogenase
MRLQQISAEKHASPCRPLVPAFPRASYDKAREYAQGRVQFGEPIASRQAIAFNDCEMAYEVECHEIDDLESRLRSGSRKDAKKESYLANYMPRNDHEDHRLRRADSAGTVISGKIR